MPTVKTYGQWGGIDYRSNDLVKNRITARDAQNTDINERGALTKRFGQTTIQDAAITNVGIWGTGTWTNKAGIKVPVNMFENNLMIGDTDDATAMTAVAKVAYLSNLNGDSAARLRGVTFASMAGNLYIATGRGPLLKYDGEKLSRTGAPTKIITSITRLGGVGQWTATTVDYKFTFTIADHNGVVTTGAASPAVRLANKLAVERPSIQLPNITELADGYKIKNEGGTIAPQPVTNTYNFQVDETIWGVGDVVFRLDAANRTVETFRLLEKIGANLFRTDMLFTNNNIWSISNVFAQVARSIDGNPYEICYEYIIDPVLVPPALVDDGATAFSLGIFSNPENAGYVPLNPKYVSTHKTQIVLSGMENEPNAVYFSDILDQEAFSPNNSFIPGFNQVSDLRGTASFQGALLTLSNSNIFVTTGILDNASGYTTDTYPGGNIGALNQNGVVETDFGLVIATASGPWVIRSLGQYPEWFGERVANYFIDRGGAAVNGLPNAAWLQSFRKLMITGSDVALLVYDAKSDTWHRWSNCNLASTLVSATNKTAYVINQNGGISDRYRKFNTSYVESTYNDDGAAISMYYRTAFDALEEWSLKKKYLRLKVFRSSNASDNIFTQQAGSYDLGIDFYYDADTQNVWSTTLSFGTATSIPYFAKTKMPNKRGYSLSITFNNSQLNKKLSISGYELEFEVTAKPRVEK